MSSDQPVGKRSDSSRRVPAPILAVLWLALVLPGSAAPGSPDLVVTDIWADGATVHYQIRNIGNGNAVGGHITTLWIDGLNVSSDTVPSALGPGERLSHAFTKYIWHCGSTQDAVGVRTDATGLVKESNELNNTRSETWKCDQAPPAFVNGPTASALTQTSAKISWDTDENCDSWVDYSRLAGPPGEHAGTAALNKSHQVTLTGLKSGSTYAYTASSTDASGNTGTSGKHYFKTLSSTGTQNLKIDSLAPTGTRGYPMMFSAVPGNGLDVDHLSFFLEGKLVETDYSAPFNFYLDPDTLGLSPQEFYTNLAIAARLVDPNGLSIDSSMHFMAAAPRCFPVELDFQSPRDDYEIVLLTGDTVPPGNDFRVSVEASETAWEERENRWGTMTIGTPVEKIEVYLDDNPAPILTDTETTWLNQDWDPVGLHVGVHHIKVKAWSHGCGAPLTSTHHLKVTGYEQRLTVESHSVLPAPEGNYFNVGISLYNYYLDPVTLDGIYDTLVGFQVVPEERDGYRVQILSFDWNTLETTVYIRFNDDVTIPKWHSYEVEYKAVPILHDGFEDYCVGPEPVSVVYFEPDGDMEEVEASLTHDGSFFSEDIFDAAAAADYLLVTNPRALYGLFPSADVDTLLGKMGELATLRQGVLGYLNMFTVVPSNFSSGDRLAVGDFVPYDTHSGGEIAMLDWAEERVKIYGGDRHLYNVGRAGSNASDRIAAGDLTGLPDLPSGFPLVVDEIVVASGREEDNGRMTIYQFQPDPEGFVEIDSFDSQFQAGDGLGVGEFETLRGFDVEDEIVVARAEDGDCLVYDHYDGIGGWSAWESIETVFRAGDGFAVGNVVNRAGDEIVVADIDADRIYIYDATGWDRYFDFDLSAGDQVRTADTYGELWSHDSDEIIVFQRSRNRITHIACTLIDNVLSAREVIVLTSSLREDDDFAGGDVLNLAKEQVLVGHGATHDGYPKGDVDIHSSLGDSAMSRDSLDNLLDDGGGWASRLDPDWVSGGSLLLVGEAQVLPAFSRDFSLAETVTVRVTDNYYASTTDDIFHPNLSVGRIIGNSPGELVKPIQASIDLARGVCHLRNRFGTVFSGSNRGPGGTSDDIDFTEERNAIASRLEDRGVTVVEGHEATPDYFFDQSNYRDIIHMTGHGNSGVWDLLCTDDVDDLFETDTVRPLVYADSCLTGRYTAGYSFAEAFLSNHAGAYVGATESGRWPMCMWLTTRFYDQLAAGRTLGECLREAKGNVIGAGDDDDEEYTKYNATIYHLFGDPKITLEWEADKSGPGPIAAPAAPETVYDPDKSTLQVTLPMYKITTGGGYQHAEIPGGGALLSPGHYEVPRYTARLALPAGIRIQDVQLQERGGMTENSKLNLPLVQVKIPGQPGDEEPSPPPGEEDPDAPRAAAGNGPQWWPERDFDWTVVENPGGTSTLMLTVYPFFYSGLTADARYYQNFTFNLAASSSVVTIRRLRTDQTGYRLGETIRAELYFESGAEQGQDVLVEAAILRGADEPVAGLPMRTLPGVRGLASCSFEWDSGGFPGDTYLLEVALRTAAGGTLARGRCAFTLGVTAGRITGLAASPECFGAGAPVGLSADLTNSGDRSLSGIVVIEARDAAEQVLARFEKDFTGLDAGETFIAKATWGAAAAGRDDCGFVAYALFDGDTAPPRELPAVLRGDLNRDRQLDLMDLLLLHYYLLNNLPWDLSDFPSCSADMNGDGKLSMEDWAALAAYLTESGS